MIAMAKKQRTLSEWRDLVESWQESGQSIPAFCADHGLGETTFYVRRKQLAEEDAGLDRQGGFEPVRAAVGGALSSEPEQLSLHFGSAKLDLPAEVEFAWVAGLMRALADAVAA